jgi:hypothetical protein
MATPLTLAGNTIGNRVTLCLFEHFRAAFQCQSTITHRAAFAGDAVLRGSCVPRTNSESGPGLILFIQPVLPIRKGLKPIHSMREAPTGCMCFRISFGAGFAQPQSLRNG